MTSGAPGTESLELLSVQPTILCWPGQPNEKKMHDQADSAKPVFNGSPLGESTLRQHRTRKKINDSLTVFPPCHVVSEKSSRSVGAPLTPGSDILLDDITKNDKPPKRSLKKKGNKKGKQYRRAPRKKLNSLSEIPCEENVDAVSPVEVLQNDLLADKLSETSSSASSLVKEVHLDKDDSENNNEYADCQSMLHASTSGGDEMDVSEPMVSSNGTLCERFSCNGVTYLNDGSNSIDASQANGSTITEYGYSFLRDQSNSCHKSSYASVSNSNSSSYDESNSDVSWNYGDDVEARLKEENRCDQLQYGASTYLNNLDEVCHLISPCLSGSHAEDPNGSFVGQLCCPEEVTDSCDHIERVQCSSEACSSKAFLLISSGRRGRRSRKTSSSGNLTVTNSVVGKDSSVSVWQKVEKLNNKESMSRAGHASAIPIQDRSALDSKMGAKPEPSRRVKQNQNRKACKQPSPDETVKMEPRKVENDALNSSRMFSRSIYKKQMPFLHQQLSSSSKHAIPQSSKNYYTLKNDMPKVPKNHSQQKGGLPVLQLVNAKDTNHTSLSTSASSHEVSPPEVGSNNPTQECGGAPAFCSLGSDLVRQTASEEDFLLSIQQDSRLLCAESKPISVASSGSTNLCTDPCTAEMEETRHAKLRTENSPQEPCKLDTTAGHLLQKWVPVGKKDMTNIDVSEASVVEDSVPVNDIFKSADIRVARNVSEFSASTNGEDSILASQGTAKPNSSGQINGSKHQASTETGTDFCKIREAVSIAYKALQRVEDIQLLIDRPLADFERFVNAASPVVNCSPCHKCCSPYLQEWISDDLCSHQTLAVCLSSIWQWYEEPSYYGLEVKAQDFRRSKGLWNSHFQFAAYFVPYLSAVQLFGRPKHTNLGNHDEEAAKMDRTSKPSPCLNSLPILAKLLPRQSNQRNCLSSCLKDDRLLGGGELIFEFFESEQPFWRRQLFDKINELIAGVKPSNCQISGDPKNLELNLHDLHPASWYCVAWYPVYRIPDGKFQAAFLTYHSLGQWVHRSSSPDQAGHMCVVSPVVGLQSYNDKGEWWFQMSRSDSENAASGNPSQVLRERLQTLNQTAAVMARANVLKHGQMCRNTHPDYEFFLSRYW